MKNHTNVAISYLNYRTNYRPVNFYWDYGRPVHFIFSFKKCFVPSDGDPPKNCVSEVGLCLSKSNCRFDLCTFVAKYYKQNKTKS